MSSILVFIKTDNDHDDPKQDWKKFKAGDVVDIQDRDNFDWGSAIVGPRSLGWWRVVVVKRMPRSAVEHLMESGLMPYVSDEPLSTADVRHQKRTHALDFAALKDSMTKAEFMSAIVKKQPMGHSPVIG